MATGSSQSVTRYAGWVRRRRRASSSDSTLKNRSNWPANRPSRASICRVNFRPRPFARRNPMATKSIPAESAQRVDLRDLPLVTIDGEDAKDFDDAVYCEPHAKGFRLIVAIADVSYYVRRGTALDASARERGTSVYFPTRVIPDAAVRAVERVVFAAAERRSAVLRVGHDRLAHGRAARMRAVYPAVMRSVRAADLRPGFRRAVREAARGAARSSGRSRTSCCRSWTCIARCSRRAQTRRARVRRRRSRVRLRRRRAASSACTCTSATRRTSSSRSA